MPRPDDVGVGVAALVVNREQKVLLGRRKGAHRAGCLAAPGGWIERGETPEDTVRRELSEEAGLTAINVSPLMWTSEDHPELGVRTVTLYHVLRPGDWTGLPKLMEPDKCEGWQWISLLQLLHDEDGPDERVFPGLLDALRALRRVVPSSLVLSWTVVESPVKDSTEPIYLGRIGDDVLFRVQQTSKAIAAMPWSLWDHKSKKHVRNFPSMPAAMRGAEDYVPDLVRLALVSNA